MAAKKLFYKIGEACKILEIQPYVLRYWETEFPFLSPNKSKSGQRVYSDRELDIIRRIKELLYDEGYTIAGAKKKLEAEMQAAEGEPEEGKGSSPGAATDKAEAPPGKSLDTRAAKQVELLRAGIDEARSQARDILRRLNPGAT